jgi:hypothetical protein
MTENRLPEDFPQSPSEAPGDAPEPDEGGPLEQVEPPPPEVRGLRWLVVPTLVGGLGGALIGAVGAANQVLGTKASVGEAMLAGAAQGGIVGLIAGGILGLIIWVGFPYKYPPQPPQEETPKRDD